MASPSPKIRHGARRVFGVWLLLATVLLVCATPQMNELGLYYDEAFLAQQARDFLEPDRVAQHPASVRSIEIFERPFPIRNAVYLGSLKSQLLIPALALAGPSPRVLRTTTLATSLIALLLAMLWANRLFGNGPALWMGLLVATDPSFYFFSQFEWGPFTTNFLCRAGGALLIAKAWQDSLSPGRPAARTIAAATGGGLLLGLGIFSRADFGLILASAGIALVIGHRDLVARALREHRALLLAGSTALIAASSPMLASMSELFSATQITAERGGLSFRAGVLWHTLDGSQFHRLMEVGGLFERAAEASAPTGLLGWILFPGVAILVADLWRKKKKNESLGADARTFLLLATLLLCAAMLALPGAVRAHHQLNLLPLPHLVVACAGAALWRARTYGPTPRVLAGVALVGLLISNLYSIGRTTQLIGETGGRGRWSDRVNDVARALDSEPSAVAVSLDWGFHEPLLFLTKEARLVEAIWEIPAARGRDVPWAFDGDSHTLYLVHDTPYDLFGLGSLFLRTMRSGKYEAVEVTPHRDRKGDIAFFGVRIGRPHRLIFDGRFRIQ